MNKCLKLIVALFCVNIMAASLLKANNLVSYKGSKLSSINANYSRSKSSTMVKQTVLSSITAKELNIEVGSNTDLKGSLIAAGYYDESGNFIDNGKLRLKTDTLTFSNLSNTRYDKSNSLSIGTNYAFKDPQQEGENKHSDSQASDSKSAESKESTAGSNSFGSNQMSGMQTSSTDMSAGKDGWSAQSKESNTDPKSKISSINYSNNRNLSYAMSKSLATIGKGELIVGDKDISSLSKDELASLQSDPNNKALYNSDDLTRLNRDSSKLSKELYSTKLNSSVDASVDMRFFSEGGRNEIKRDYEDASTIYDAIYQIATTENAKVSKIFDYIGGFTSGYDKDSMSLAANLDVLDDPGADIFKKQRAAQDIANQMGVKVKFANLNRGSGGKFNSDDPNAVYINTKHINNAKEFMTFLRHELVHRSDNKRGAFIPKDPAQNQFATNYALGMLSMSEKALRLNGRSLNDYSPKVNPNDKTVVADTKYFYSLDQRKSDDLDLVYFNKTHEKFNYNAAVEYKGDKKSPHWVGVAAHGSEGNFIDLRDDNKFKGIGVTPVSQLAADIKKFDPQVDSVSLYMCFSGKDGKNTISVAQDLANQLGVPVYGYPNKFYFNWLFPSLSSPAYFGFGGNGEMKFLPENKGHK